MAGRTADKGKFAFRVTGASHVLSNGQGILDIFPRGSLIYSDENLVKKHVNKFQREPEAEKGVNPIPPTPEKIAAAIQAAGVEEEPESLLTDPVIQQPNLPPIVSPLGEDVTKDFPAAVKAGVGVLRNPDGKYAVVDITVPDTNLADKYLSIKQLDRFLASVQ